LAIGEIRITDNLDELLAILPPDIAGPLKKMSGLLELIEVVLDLGRRPEARFESHFTYLKEEFVTTDEIKFVVDRVCKFGGDNRAGIPRTLHRISAIKNRTNDIIGLTLRVGRAVYGTISLISDLVNTDRSILLMGRPGVGKTTMLREMARVLADDFQKRVVIVDTSNEIAGDGDIPHPGIGLARRMQVPHHDLQHEVMIEAVQNHMPEVIVVDEIGTEQEAYAARTIAERGVQLIATAHGNSLTNLLLNPTLSDLVGGIQAVTLSDEEARRRGTQKTVLERKAPPTFDVVIEIHEKDRLAIHENVDTVVDQILRGVNPQPEIRERDEKGGFKVVQARSLPPSKAVFQNGMKNNRGKASGRPDDYPFSHEEPPPCAPPETPGAGSIPHNQDLPIRRQPQPHRKSRGDDEAEGRGGATHGRGRRHTHPEEPGAQRNQEDPRAGRHCAHPFHPQQHRGADSKLPEELLPGAWEPLRQGRGGSGRSVQRPPVQPEGKTGNGRNGDCHKRSAPLVPPRGDGPPELLHPQASAPVSRQV